VKNAWVIAGHACELRNQGDFLVLPWRADGEVALTNIDGEVIAFDNRCPHRGARIFTEMHGCRPPVCRYHGRCAKPEQMTRFKVASRNGFIFVNEPGPEVQCPGDLAAFIDGAPALTLHSTLAFTMGCDWTVAVENALDVEHVAHVHEGSLASLRLSRATLYTWGDGSSMEWFNSDARLPNMSRVMPDERDFDYIHAHLFPSTCLSSTRGWTYSLQNYFPTRDGKTSFVHRLYAAPTRLPIPEFFDSAARMNERVFREDAEICALVPARPPGRLGPQESRIAHFRSYV
jgi:phenylpropionate dioxygenase-like ring-hydroxylating dioxygenase large terminal subunit